MNHVRTREITDRTARLLPLAIDRLQRLQGNVGGGIGLSVIQLQVMEYIHRHGPSSIATLTRALRRAQSSISELVDRLGQKGLVGRKSTADRRKSLVALSRKGKRFMVECDACQRAAVDNEFATLSPEHRQRFLENLQEILQITDQIHRPPTVPATSRPSATLH